MPANFDLIITADTPNHSAEFNLRDENGNQLAFRQTDFKTIALSHQHGLFDLGKYLRHYVVEGQEAASVADIGVCIAEQVLGEEIFRYLWASEAQRTLRIQLPGATEGENHLAAALAQVPWEFARPSADKETLGERNLLVRVVHLAQEDMAAPITQPLELKPGESLRVLFVFAEARGSRPLGARKERRELLNLFKREIYPLRRIEAHFLTHGVTRQRLEAQIKENGGYHIVHWSGHGHLNLLELAKAGGSSDHLSGDELLDLFTDAGGFIPRLFFLSACHSGDILRVKDWNDFMAVAQGKEPGAKQATTEETKQIEMEEQPGYTGTAHALLQGGVPSVIAMRYAVGDEYARELSVEFYRALLAHAQPKNAAAALTMARQMLLDQKRATRAHFVVCDHATPVLYGANDPGLSLQQGRSSGLDTRNPRLHQITELTTAGHEHFVGRTWELADLGAEFIGSSHSAEVKPVAVITGLGGMGKTALTAEALALWESQFEWVLLYQAKPNALGIDRDFLWNIHIRLTDKSDAYRARIAANSRDAIWLPVEGDFTGARRMELMFENLIAVLRAHAILLVLDNFETNLKPQPEPGASAGEPLWACQDPAWERCLAQLAAELAGTPSRVLITCRRPLAALKQSACQRVLLGPLPPGEAALYLREHAGLSRMFFNADAGERALAMRLLNASRFHPLLMDRLARLATGGAALRAQLMQALETLEQTKDFAQLPALFAATPGDAKEMAYLNDALATSLDQLIHDASPDARRLLWMIAVANESIELGLLQSVWSGESHEQEKLRQLKQMMELLPTLPPDVQAKAPAVPPEVRAKLDALPPPASARPDTAPLLRHLIAVGLVTEERSVPEDENPALTCHELVRERIRAWMEAHPQDHDGLSENSIRLGYAERLAATFNVLQHWNMTDALQAGSRALVYCVQAGAYEQLGGFASRVITSTSNANLVANLLPYLEAAAEFAPEGQTRWHCLCNLADALMHSDQLDASLVRYEQAAKQARNVIDSGCKNSRKAWWDFARVSGNWANALFMIGDLESSRRRRIESIEAIKKAERPASDLIAGELEALRIDIVQGQFAEALPRVEARLVEVQSWWRRLRSGQPTPEATDPEDLARLLISTLSVATEAYFAQRDWEHALHHIDAAIEVKQTLGRSEEDIAQDRMNRAHVLGWLGRFGEAIAELEAGLQIFQNDAEGKAKTLDFLSTLFAQQGDVAQAIAQQRRALASAEQLPLPRGRAAFHNNLAAYLERSGAPSALAEFPRHHLAALIYRLVAKLWQHLKTSLRNYVIRFRRAHAAGAPLAVPRVAELLADTAFRPLDEWLRQRQVDVDELQAVVDQYLEMARQAALEQSTEQSP